MVPKVKIVLGKLKDYFDFLEYLILDDNFFINRIIFEYPEIENILKNSKNKKKDLKLFFKNIEKEKKDELIEAVNKTKEIWDNLNDDFMKAFEEIHEIKWNKKDEKIIGIITLNPICPIDIKHKSFDLFYRFNEKEIIDVFLHEISHFIFFKKFKEIYSKVNDHEFESPHLIWKISEIMPGIILQDERIQKIYENKKLSVYDNIKKIRINNRLILDILQDFYDNKESFKDFVIKSYDFIKNNQKEFEKQF